MSTRSTTMGLLWAILILGGRSWALSPANVPSLGAPVEIRLGGRTPMISSAAVDAAGRLFLVDQGHAQVLVYTPEGKLLRTIGGAGEGHGRFLLPLNLSVWGDTLAVFDLDDHSLQLFSASTGRFCQALKCPKASYPGEGFFITPQRVVFTAIGFPAMPVPGQPVEAWLLFSTLWNGTGLRVNELRHFSAGGYERSHEAEWASWGYCTPWGQGRWAVTHALPRKITVLDQEGRTIRTSEAEPASDAELPVVVGTIQETKRALANARKVIGLVPAGPWLGVIWEQRRQKVPFEVEWLDEELRSVATKPVPALSSLSLTNDDSCDIEATDAFGRVYLLVCHDHGNFSFSSRLYVLHLTLPEKGHGSG